MLGGSRYAFEPCNLNLLGSDLYGLQDGLNILVKGDKFKLNEVILSCLDTVEPEAVWLTGEF